MEFLENLSYIPNPSWDDCMQEHTSSMIITILSKTKQKPMEPWFYFQKPQVPFYASKTRVQTYRKIDSQVGQTSALFKPATLVCSWGLYRE